jgi:hypothetical protein
MRLPRVATGLPKTSLGSKFCRAHLSAKIWQAIQSQEIQDEQSSASIQQADRSARRQWLTWIKIGEAEMWKTPPGITTTTCHYSPDRVTSWAEHRTGLDLMMQ